jgi:PPOX class probable F420-dependent enzyme
MVAMPATESPLSPGQIELIGPRGHGVLSTLKRDGRPQLSVIGYGFDADRLLVRISLTNDRAKTRNLRRDPRVSLLVTTKDLRPYVVLEGTARLTDIARDPHDATMDELIDLYRNIAGEHPDWDEYRAAMIADERLVLSFTVEHAYGFAL